MIFKVDYIMEQEEFFSAFSRKKNLFRIRWMLFTVSFCVVLNSASTKTNLRAEMDANKTNLSSCSGFELELNKYVQADKRQGYAGHFIPKAGNTSTRAPEQPVQYKSVCDGLMGDGEGAEGPAARPRCCTAWQEARLMGRAPLQLISLVASELSARRQTFLALAAKFDDFCTRLIERSKRNLYDTFVQTYGPLFQPNSEIFVELFRQLQAFYGGADIHLPDTVDSFFTALMQRMFVMQNADDSLSEGYLGCVAEQISVLRPFGDVPQKLSRKISRSFIAARTFSQGLALGRDVLLGMTKLNFSRSCHSTAARLLHCPYCVGGAELKPCTESCLTVLESCLEQHSHLHPVWKVYAGEIVRMASRLAGPFSIESVIESIDVTISDAILIYQDNADSISNQIFQDCGESQHVSRTMSKRSSTNITSIFPVRRQSSGESFSPSDALFVNLLRDAEKKLGDLSCLWESLAASLCRRMGSTSGNDIKCWTESGRSRSEQLNDTDARRVAGRKSVVVESTMTQINAMVERLRRANEGLNVDWIDADDEVEGSGSGADARGGSGSDRDGSLPGDISFTANIPDQPDIYVAKHHQAASKCSERRMSYINLFSAFLTVLLINLTLRA